MADISPEELSQLFEKQRNGIQLTTEEIRKLGAGTKEFSTNLKALGMASQNAALGLSGFTKSLANGEASFKSLNPLIDGITSGLGELAKTIPWAGNLAAGSLKLAGEGAKFLLDQLQIATNSFQEMSQVGAVTAKGMTGLKEQFLDSRMTLQGFQKTVKENANVLARFKGTVGTGAEDFSKIIGTLADPKNSLGMGLRKIGFTADEMGDATAGYISQQIMMGQIQNKTQDELIKGSHRYALELDQLAKLTGMSRKEAQSQRDKALSEGRFLAGTRALERLGPAGVKASESLKNLQGRFAKDSPAISQGIRDSLNSISTDAAKQLMNATGGASFQIIQLLKNNVISEEEANKRIREAINRTLPSIESLNQFTGDAAKTFPPLNELVIATTASYKNAGKTAKGQQKVDDKLTDSAVTAQVQLENMSRNIQSFSFALLPFATDAVSAFTGALDQAIQYMAGILGIELPSVGGGQGGGGAGAQSVFSGNANVRDLRNLGKMSGGQIASSMAARATEGVGYGIAAGAKGLGLETVGGGIERLVKKASRSRQEQETLMTSIDQLIDFTGDSGSRENFQRLSTDVQIAFLKMADEYRVSNGGKKKLKIQSSFRDYDTQKKLYEAYKERGFTGIPAAKPGTSLHERGYAIDLDQSTVSELLQTGLLNKYGFLFNPRDPVHIFKRPGFISANVADNKEGFAQGGISQGPKSGYMAMLHGLEAIVPLSNNRSIPVSFKDTGASQLNTASFDQNLPILNDAINRQSAVLQQQLEKSEAMIQALNRFASGDQMQVMIDKLQNINDKINTGNDINAKLLQVSM